MAQRAENVDIRACETLLPGLQRFSPKLVNLILSKFPGGACPQTLLAVACLHTKHDHFKSNGYGPAWSIASKTSQDKLVLGT